MHEAAHSYSGRRALVDAVPEDLLRAAQLADLLERVDAWRRSSGSTADGVSRVDRFVLSDEYVELRASLRRLAEDQIAPNAADADEHEEYPVDELGRVA